ncbi:beta-lactamase/transpeptidase-like protein [Powellomyces hirtus]|nr:beta-lactamase/transpeptidase-like protein [Powellomyces hirtus]
MLAGPHPKIPDLAAKTADVSPNPLTHLTAVLDSCVRNWVDQKAFSGSVLVAVKGKIILRQGYGLAVREHNVPNLPSTKFRVGSSSKQFVAVTALKLQEARLLDLSKTLAEFALPGIPEEIGKHVTLYNLLQHSSGIPDYVGFTDYEPNQSLPGTLEDVLKTFADKPLEFVPGTKWSYSNSNYILIVIIIESVLGGRFEDYVREHLLLPLGMNDTDYEVTGVPVPNFGHGYRCDSEGRWTTAPFLHMSHVRAVGGLYSTVDDMYKWRQALVYGSILSAESKQNMFADHLIHLDEKKKTEHFYGLGIFVRSWPTLRNRCSVGHGSDLDGFRGMGETYPAEDVSISFLSNNQTLDYMNMHLALAEIVFDETASVIKCPTNTAATSTAMNDLPESGESDANQELTAALDACVKKWTIKRNFSGSILVARRDQLLLRRGYGLAVREHAVPNTPNTKFRIGSMSKQFVSATALKMQEQGMLKLSQTLADHLQHIPAFPKEKGVQITLSMLLRHTSGIPCYVRLDGYHDRKSLPAELSDVVRRFADLPLEHTPGTKYSYSNSNYLLMVLIMEGILGHRFEHYVKKFILEPLDMTDSGYEVTGTVIPGFASGYQCNDKGIWNKAPFLHMSHVRAVGGLYSTVDDLLKWRRALILGDLLCEDSRKAMYEMDLIRVNPEKEPPQQYGLGLFRLQKPNNRISIAHASELDGARGFLETYPEEQVTVGLLSNNQSFDFMEMQFEIAALVFGDIRP